MAFWTSVKAHICGRNLYSRPSIPSILCKDKTLIPYQLWTNCFASKPGFNMNVCVSELAVWISHLLKQFITESVLLQCKLYESHTQHTIRYKQPFQSPLHFQWLGGVIPYILLILISMDCLETFSLSLFCIFFFTIIYVFVLPFIGFSMYVVVVVVVLPSNFLSSFRSRFFFAVNGNVFMRNISSIMLLLCNYAWAVLCFLYIYIHSIAVLCSFLLLFWYIQSSFPPFRFSQH